MNADAFLAAITDNPGDPDPRLAYADWLDERGDPAALSHRLIAALRPVLDDPRSDAPRLAYAATCDQYADPRGEFIRLQVAAASDPHPPGQNSPHHDHKECRHCRRQRRIGELLPTAWQLYQPVFLAAHWSASVNPSEVIIHDPGNPPRIILNLRFDRGFVGKIVTTLETFHGAETPCPECTDNLPSAIQCERCDGTGVIDSDEGMAPDLFAHLPVTSVILSDCGPGSFSEFGVFPIYPAWQRRSAARPVARTMTTTWTGNYVIPDDIYAHLRGFRHPPGDVATYNSQSLALTSLSDAAADWGRSVAAGATHPVECPERRRYGAERHDGLPGAGCKTCSGKGTVTTAGLPPLPVGD